MPCRSLLVGAALMLVSAGAPHAVADAPDDGLPPALSADARALRDLLAAIANGAGNVTWPQVNASHAALAPAFESLHPQAAERLASYMGFLEPAMRDGNGTDAQSLAQAAARTVQRDLVPVAEDWEKHRTGVVVGAPREKGDGLEVPLVLVNAPPGGFAAFEVALHYDPERLIARGARLASGEGDARVDAANGSVHFASFDARGFAGIGSAGAPVELGRAVFEAAAGVHPVRVEVVDLVDRQGRALLALGVVGEVDAAAAVPAGFAAGLGRAFAVGAVLVLGVGAAVAARKFLKV